MTYPIDTTKFELRGIEVAPRIDRDSQKQALNRDGLPRWTVTALARSEGQRPELLSISVASVSQPAVLPMESIEVENLVIGHWSTESGSGVYFTADSVVSA